MLPAPPGSAPTHGSGRQRGRWQQWVFSPCCVGSSGWARSGRGEPGSEPGLGPPAPPRAAGVPPLHSRGEAPTAKSSCQKFIITEVAQGGGSGAAAGGYPQPHHAPSRAAEPGAAAALTGPPGASSARIISCLRAFPKTHGPRLPEEHVPFHQPGGGGTRPRRVPAPGQGLPRAARPAGAARPSGAAPGPRCARSPPEPSPEPCAPAGGCALPTPSAAGAVLPGQCPRSASRTARRRRGRRCRLRPAELSGAVPPAPLPWTLRGDSSWNPRAAPSGGLTVGWDKTGWMGIGQDRIRIG